MPNPFEKFDAEENQKRYDTEQRQRAMERRIRDTKRKTMGLKTAMDNANTPEAKAEFEMEYQRKAALLQKQNKAYREFCETNNLKTLNDRLSITRWDRKQAAAARRAARRYNEREKNLIFIQDDATIKAASGLPKKLVNLPNETLAHTLSIDMEMSGKLKNGFHGVTPKGVELTEIEVMAGAGTSTPIRDLKRLYSVYQRSPDKWQKKSGTAFGDKYHYVIHWYEHEGFVPIEEIKLKGMKEN